MQKLTVPPVVPPAAGKKSCLFLSGEDPEDKGNLLPGTPKVCVEQVQMLDRAAVSESAAPFPRGLAARRPSPSLALFATISFER